MAAITSSTAIYPDMAPTPSRTSCSTWEDDASPITPAQPVQRSDSSAKEPLTGAPNDWFETPDVDIPPPYSAAAPAMSQRPAQPAVAAMGTSTQIWAEEDLSRVAARNAMANQSASRKKSIQRNKSRKKSIHLAKSLRPGIKVDTSYSRHRGGAPQQVFPHGHPHNRSASKGNGTFVTLSDIKSVQESGDVAHVAKKSWFPKGLGLGRGPESASQGQGPINRDNSPSTAQNFRLKAMTLRRKARESPNSPTPNTGLSPDYPQASPLDSALLKDISPSDRPITIGISVPSDVADAHSVSPQSAQDYRNLPNRSINDVVETPTIIVTPAQHGAEWSSNPFHRPRPASSIYSRHTSHVNASARSSIAPPVPALPPAVVDANPFADELGRGGHDHQPSHGRDSVATAFEEDDTPKERRRIMSTDTVFEDDDDTPLTSVSRNGKNYPNALTVETTVDDRRSDGWWNVITTPFEATRPSSRASKFTRQEPGTPTSVPEVPPLDFATFARQRNLSPVSPENVYSGWSPDSTAFDENSPHQISPAQRQANNGISRHPTTTTAPFPSLAARVHEDLDEHPMPNHWPDFDSASPRHRSVDEGNPFDKPRRDSRDSQFSPSGKYIPVVLGSDRREDVLGSGNAFGLRLTRNQPKETSHSHQWDHQHPRPSHEESEIVSPTSREDAFSPVDVGVAAVGTIFNARAIENPQPKTVAAASETRQAAAYPGPSSYSYSTRSSSREAETRRSSKDLAHPPQVYLWPHHQPDGFEMADDGSRRGTRTLKPPSRRASPYQAPSEKYAPPPPRDRGEERGRKWCGLKGRDEKTKKRRKKWFCCFGCCTIFLIIVIILSAVLATQLGHGDDGDDSDDGGSDTTGGSGSTPTGSQWLNLTDFPPMPTGFSTVARPKAAIQNSRCIQPSTMWSCALPKEVQDGIKPNAANQPNFKFDIVFDKDTYNSLPAGGQSAVGRLIKRFLGIRDNAFEDAFKPSPPVPSIEDQKFLGKTTDGNSKPFEGELTPFYISFFDTTQSPSRVKRAAESSSSTSSASFPNLSNAIPPPDELQDGTAAPANLLPVPSNQPLRLYDRGLPSEHYGFYTYFDKSIFLKSDNVLSGEGNLGTIPADRNGGSRFSSASVRCTWAQTRFLVQIWTKAQDNLGLLKPPSGTSSSPLPSSTGGRNSPSASYFVEPGSFPYPVSIVMDRHGGDASVKSVYCYGMNKRGRILDNQRQFQLEDREVGGHLVNPNEGPFGNVTGPVDGGTGGCQCEWINWEKKL